MNTDFNFKKVPDSCVGLLDYVQRAFDETWRRIYPTVARTPPPIFTSKPPLSIIRARRRIGKLKEDPTAEQIREQQKLEFERQVSLHESFVQAFREVSVPLRDLFANVDLPCPEANGFERPFFDFAHDSVARAVPDCAAFSLTRDMESFWPRLSEQLVKAAFDRGELPSGWLPAHCHVRFAASRGIIIDRYPSFPIRSSHDLIQWLLRWIDRCAMPKRNSQHEESAEHLQRLSGWVSLHDQESFTPVIGDLARELRNSRRALFARGITGAPTWEGDPPDMAVAEDRVMRLVDWLRENEGHLLQTEPQTKNSEGRRSGGTPSPLNDRSSTLKPPAELLHELSKQQGAIVSFLWASHRAIQWHNLPDDCWREGKSTSDQTQSAISSALKRLRDKLNKLPDFGVTLEVHASKQTTKLLRNRDPK